MNLSAYKTGNTFKTFIFLAAMTALLLGIGYLVGGTGGLVFFLFLSIAFNFAMYWFSGPMALKMSKAKAVTEEEEPELHRMVGVLAGRAGVPKPGVYVIPSEQPNAFATGRNPQHAAVAVTAGIQRALGPRELEGVIAHEMAHIKNRDILIASIAAMIAGAISYLMYALLFFGGDDENPLGAIGSILMFMLAPLAAGIMQMAISRQREYVADTTGAELLGRPAAARRRPREAAGRSGRDPDGGQPGRGAALYRQPAVGGQGARDEPALLDPPADGGAHRATPAHGRTAVDDAPNVLERRPGGEFEMGVREQVESLVGDSGAKHKRLVEYVTRQLKGGRSLAQVLEDPYVTNRLSPLERRALLEEPEIIEATHDEVLETMRSQLEGILSAG